MLAHRYLLEELGFAPSTPTSVFTDNEGCLRNSQNAVSSQRSKHIDVKHFFIRELVEKGVVHTFWVSTADMPADLNTKAVATAIHERLLPMVLGRD